MQTESPGERGGSTSSDALLAREAGSIPPEKSVGTLAPTLRAHGHTTELVELRSRWNGGMGEQEPVRRVQERSKRSRFMTLSHAATKSFTNLCCPSSEA